MSFCNGGMVIFMVTLALVSPMAHISAQTDDTNMVGRFYPLFSQCDRAWGSDQMGVDGPGHRATICQEGCAMSSLAMALYGLGIPINGDAASPATLNKWLLTNNGYHCDGGDCDNMVLNAVERLTPRVKFVSEAAPQAIPVIESGLASGEFLYLAHVSNRHHFVLLTGATFNHTGFWVNDPYYNVSWYPYADIADILLYQVVKAEPRVTASPVIPRKYPLYKQCDQTWAHDVMTHKTICQVGCLMSSTAMGLASYGITIAGAHATPKTFNHWLRSHGGYVGDGLNEPVVPKLNHTHIIWPADGMHKHNDITMPTLRQWLQKGRVMIANVNKGGHFVLATGWDKDSSDIVYVNDPGFERTHYSMHNDIVGWRIFDLK